MLNNILNIWQKELLDIVRDRKGLRQTLVVPLILGIFYAVLNPLLGTLITSRQEGTLVLPVQGVEYAGQEFIDMFARFDIELEPFDGDLEATIASAEEAAGLIFTPGFGDNIAAEKEATLIVRTNNTSGGLFGGGISLGRLELALNAYNQQITVERLTAREVDLAVLAPVNLDVQDLASAAQRAGAAASFFLPILVALSAVQGGMFIAIDVTAGEKERGTLESLLVTPSSDAEIFVGKLVAVFTVTAVPIVLTLFGFWAASSLLPESMTDGVGALPLNIIFQAILVSLPLALFAYVVLMIISIRTKTFKDAQSALSPVIFVVLFTAMAAAFVPPTGASLAYLLPVYGTSAIVGVLTLGGIVPANAVLFSVIGNLLATVVGIVIAMQIFNRERLLYSM
ncbi:MAG: sodium ABC transporter permease [Ardenticatenaceae bacterium]|nr:MAG: sodium ABC transporter permease [Ardenticatenaceae bacterium]